MKWPLHLSLSIKILLLIFLGGFIAFFAYLKFNFSSDVLPRVIITQIAEHPALDEERRGLMDRLKELGYEHNKSIFIDYHNAQGNISLATEIAIQAINENPKVIVAISTPSAQAALPLCQKQKVPLIFSAVSNPVAAKIVPSLEQKDTCLTTGICDTLIAGSQLAFILKIIPSLKSLGVLYNPSESNSVEAVKELREEAKKRGIHLREGTATRASEVGIVVSSLVNKVEAFYVPTDNTFVSAMKSLSQIALTHKIPVFAGDAGSVKNGAIAAEAHDRYKIGQKLADMVISVIKGTHVGRIPIIVEDASKSYISVSTMKQLEIVIPITIMSNAEKIP